MKKERIIYYDFLRIVAIFGVIMIHVSAENWYVDIVDGKWLFNNIMNNLVETWPVPMFVTISGAIFLSSNKITLSNIFTKYISRIALILIVWHTVYFFYQTPEFSLYNLGVCMKQLMLGQTYSHLWYLYLMLGLYLLTPILAKLVKALDQKELFYFIVLGFITSTFIQTIGSFIGLNLNLLVAPYIVLNVNRYLMYFLLGYYLNTYGMKHYKAIFYGSSSTLLLCIIYETVMCMSQNQKVMYNLNFLGVLITGSAFVYAKECFHTKRQGAISEMGKLTLGVYLVHFIVEKELVEVGIHSNMMNPIVGNVLVSILILIISYAISYILSKIPVIRKVVL